MSENKQASKIIQGVEGATQNVIKGGYYVAPSGPAEPLVQTSTSWGTAMPSLASTPAQQSQPTQGNQQIQQPVQQSAPKQNTK